jgi:ERCC4-type nuclease
VLRTEFICSLFAFLIPDTSLFPTAALSIKLPPDNGIEIRHEDSGVGRHSPSRLRKFQSKSAAEERSKRELHIVKGKGNVAGRAETWFESRT